MVINRQTSQKTIVERIVDHYAMLEDSERGISDITALAAQIETQLTITYRQVIQAQLTLYGCQKLATGPDAQSLRWIQDKAKDDATSIANTYNRELKNRVERLRKENPKGNRFFYLKALDSWLVQRNAYKIPSISLNTLTAAREYAQTRFVRENGIQGKWIFTGPPPVCKVCIRIKALGAVTFETTQKRRLPAHVGCPHKWSQLVPKAINCAEAWTG